MSANKYIAEVKARWAAATPGPFFGRSEKVTTERGGAELFWCLYNGEAKDGYVGKLPGALLRCHGDAVVFQHARTDVDRLVAGWDAMLAAMAEWDCMCVKVNGRDKRICARCKLEAELDRIAGGGG